MLDTQILAKTYKLKEMLINSKQYKAVKKAEQDMLNNAYLILDKYSKAVDEYNNAIRFKDYGSNINKAQEYLFKVKLELDNDEYVKKYKQEYKKMNHLLKEIEDIIYEGIFKSNKINID